MRKKTTSSRDPNRISATQAYEVNYLAKKHDLPVPLVRNVFAQEGPLSSDVERYLLMMKRNARR